MNQASGLCALHDGERVAHQQQLSAGVAPSPTTPTPTHGDHTHTATCWNCRTRRTETTSGLCHRHEALRIAESIGWLNAE